MLRFSKSGSGNRWPVARRFAKMSSYSPARAWRAHSSRGATSMKHPRATSLLALTASVLLGGSGD
jgi:hypothetical protein